MKKTEKYTWMLIITIAAYFAVIAFIGFVLMAPKSASGQIGWENQSPTYISVNGNNVKFHSDAIYHTYECEVYYKSGAGTYEIIYTYTESRNELFQFNLNYQLPASGFTYYIKFYCIDTKTNKYHTFEKGAKI